MSGSCSSSGLCGLMRPQSLTLNGVTILITKQDSGHCAAWLSVLLMLTLPTDMMFTHCTCLLVGTCINQLAVSIRSVAELCRSNA